jgi:hypothetical protein
MGHRVPAGILRQRAIALPSWSGRNVRCLPPLALARRRLIAGPEAELFDFWARRLAFLAILAVTFVSFIASFVCCE